MGAKALPAGGAGIDEEQWRAIAQKHWLRLSGSKTEIKADFLRSQIWDPLMLDGFKATSLFALENLELLERYLWPGYDDDSTNSHVLLIILLVTIKVRQGLSTWKLFEDRPEDFSSLFRRALALVIDTSIDVLQRKHLLVFIIHAFQSLDHPLIRRECAPLVSINIWHNLATSEIRAHVLSGHHQLQKAWRASERRFEAADERGKGRLRFERSWLYTLLLDFLARVRTSSPVELEYNERFMELLIDLLAQLPTRRYVNTLLQDLNITALVRSALDGGELKHALLADLLQLLQHYSYFPVNDFTGQPRTEEEQEDVHYMRLAHMQQVAINSFPEKLKLLALSNNGAVEKRADLYAHLNKLDDHELSTFTADLFMRTEYPSSVTISFHRNEMLEAVIAAHEQKRSFQDAVSEMYLLPTENSLYDKAFCRNERYNGANPVAIPKLNLQYLSVSDFLWRSFVLHRHEQFFEVRKYLEDIVKRLRPKSTNSTKSMEFQGRSKLALPIARPAILESGVPRVGATIPSYVRAEITLNTAHLNEAARSEWEGLRVDDVVFLISVSEDSTSGQGLSSDPVKSRHLKIVRAAEVVHILDDTGRIIREPKPDRAQSGKSKHRVQRLIVNLDAVSFEHDKQEKANGRPDVYEHINVIVRRSRRENNFKKTLETIQNLTLQGFALPAWFQDVFLGFGDPNAASYSQLPNKLESLNLRDTLLDWNHLETSFPSKTIIADDGDSQTSNPPYVIREVLSPEVVEDTSSKKRRREEVDGGSAKPQKGGSIMVSTYEVPLSGPYPEDVPRGNKTRFTATQVEAIRSGTQPGLTVIVGPPGTGKTDVATQIISNIYHNFPEQRTLLIAHSNQALNQLFQKITCLDIDGRHLLRLGQGESDLESEESYSKFGRVESFLEKRNKYLSQVTRLAANLEAPGAHGSSCETAAYFNSVYVLPAWKKFWNMASDKASDPETLIKAFPFTSYFYDTPEPLFYAQKTRNEVLSVASSCERHIEKIFCELEHIRPFELMRNTRDKTNYLMIKEARIIAMTATHAAMRRSEICEVGFKYDNIIMEEAAQVTEIENFVPLALQKVQYSHSQLQRIVLLGDHMQNSPVVQNMALRQFSKLEQSMFLRLIRLGVRTVSLDAQGRARASLAALYKWRYPALHNLPVVLTDDRFLGANAGLRYEYQFIDVPDYKGKGEAQPSPHFFQNLGEAEYVVAMYQYMRLLGYPADEISILTTYAGQRALIRDVLNHRCSGNDLFGMPRIVTTVDKYQGEQNGYILLSLVRTTRPGYLRDLRRLTVALSRARLGLYIFGRRSVFEKSAEIAQGLELLLARPSKLMITTDEMHPTNRSLNKEIQEVEMTGVEHLGQYVYEITQAKVEMLKAGTIKIEPGASNGLGKIRLESDDDDFTSEYESDTDSDDSDSNLDESAAAESEKMEGIAET